MFGACRTGRVAVEPTVSEHPWWENEQAACPPGAAAQGHPLAQVACIRRDGSLHGHITYWNNGYRVYDGQYRDNRRDGEWAIWRRGTLTETRVYAGGRLIRTKTHQPPTPSSSCVSSPDDCDDDGVKSVADFCPTDREDVDGWMDDDGCPDPDFDDACAVEDAPCPPGG
jgi:hypothetical protein